MAERFTVPSRDRMEWLGEPGPSADNAHGHIAGAQSGGTRAPPASSQKNASPRLATDGLDELTPEVWADARWNALSVSRTMFGVN